jgi:hypothetical protein
MFAAVTNGAVTGLWAVTRDRSPSWGDDGAGYWWPLWVGFFWGLGPSSAVRRHASVVFSGLMLVTGLPMAAERPMRPLL